MNQSERYEKAQTITELQEQIAELTAQLGKEIASIDGFGYTAEVVTSNIYQVLGVNGYSNSYSGDAQQVIEKLYSDDYWNDDDDYEDDEDDSNFYQEEIEYQYVIVDSFPTALPKEVYKVASPFLAQGMKINALIAIRAETGWYLSEALNAYRILESFMRSEV